jgi:hypothetical protein
MWLYIQLIESTEYARSFARTLSASIITAIHRRTVDMCKEGATDLCMHIQFVRESSGIQPPPQCKTQSLRQTVAE